MKSSYGSRQLKSLKKYAKAISRVACVIGAISASAMALLTTADVLLRYFLNSPIPGTMELVQYLMVIAVFMFMIYTTTEKGHVIIQFLVSRLPFGASRIQTVIISGLCTLIFGFVTYSVILDIPRKYNDHLESAILRIPVYPFTVIIALAAVLITWIFFLEFLNNLKLIKEK